MAISDGNGAKRIGQGEICWSKRNKKQADKGEGREREGRGKEKEKGEEEKGAGKKGRKMAPRDFNPY